MILISFWPYTRKELALNEYAYCQRESRFGATECINASSRAEYWGPKDLTDSTLPSIRQSLESLEKNLKAVKALAVNEQLGTPAGDLPLAPAEGYDEDPVAVNKDGIVLQQIHILVGVRITRAQNKDFRTGPQVATSRVSLFIVVLFGHISWRVAIFSLNFQLFHQSSSLLLVHLCNIESTLEIFLLNRRSR
ncbi:uncharacterized protein BO97DRAFT_48365 [Aspergillus homomorphus CBS 101889]|uniref:Uncharacterized protein n=1 Tax=Aspergillus homomorphus (strain CBS 101889) TaxID=1450537 RepID=A0A395HY90_ASPHC|nr:hypothetical protein BO97DRAFT_48365 [Aspergillus homomorphus CBS 101889]RAL12902.1 hypothetical protein BO97DRAFT_48365 [Aspergillus homomorphus CBS 101889]